MQKKIENFAVFYKFSAKNFGSSQKSSTFAPAKRNKDVLLSMTLGYGVMVTLQILVLSFLVRVRVPQRRRSPSNCPAIFFFLHHTKANLPAVTLRANSEVNPDSSTPHLDDQLIEILLCLVCDIQ